MAIEWFIGAQTNICYNAVDRHVAASHGERVAFFWEGNDSAHTTTVTYAQLQDLVCRIANYLKGIGVKAGDDVTIYMPMVPELPAAMVRPRIANSQQSLHASGIVAVTMTYQQ